VVNANQVPSVPTVTALEVTDEVLLDVREHDEWSAGRAPLAVHIPMHEIPDRFAEIPAGRPLSVICKVGGRSAHVTAWLIQNGVEARNVQGGMYAWAAADLPLVGDTDRPWIA
jgi:rhodanese-related sulfurtransferase